MKDTHGKGNITFSKVIARLTELGFRTFIPFGDGGSCDLVVEQNKKLLRVQCKTGHMLDGCIVFNCYSVGRNGKSKHYDDEIDVFMVYSPETGKVYEIPFEDAPHSKMSLRVVETTRQDTRINSAKKYEL